jgi:transposase
MQPEAAMLWRRGKAYSQDLRERVFAAADEGQRVGQIAAMLRVSVSYVSKVLSRRRQTGMTTALPQRCHVPRKLAGLEDAIRARVRAFPDATLTELGGWLEQTYCVRASTGLLCKTLTQLDLTYKKIAARGRAGSAGRRSGAPRVARQAARPDPAQAGVHR